MRSPLLLAVAATAALAAGGCGSSSGTERTIATTARTDATTTISAADAPLRDMTAAGLLAASRAAVGDARGVHVVGRVDDEDGNVLTLDLAMAAGQGAKGSFARSGQVFDIVALGEEVYLRGSDSFYRATGGAATARLMRGKWLRITGADGDDFQSIVSFTSMDALLPKLLAVPVSGAKRTSTFQGGPAYVVPQGTAGERTDLTIAAHGQPYPLLAVDPDDPARRRLQFLRWNEPVTVDAPPAGDTIDLAELRAEAEKG